MNLHDLQSLAKSVNIFFYFFGVCVRVWYVHVYMCPMDMHNGRSSGILFYHSTPYSLVQVLLVNLELDC